MKGSLGGGASLLRGTTIPPNAKRFATITITPEEMEIVAGPGVYVYCNGWQVLYVGSGQNMIGRALATVHHRKEVRAAATHIKLYPCISVNQARAKEIRFIKMMKPKYNGKRMAKVTQPGVAPPDPAFSIPLRGENPTP
jgi:hypothetical protein